MAVLVYLSPVFIVNSLSAYVSVRYENIIYSLTEWLNELMIIFRYQGYGEIATTTNVAENFIGNYGYVSLTGCRMIFYGMMILISLVAILKLCVAERVEKSDYFIPGKYFRSIFICGVTVCGGLLLGDLYLIFSNQTNMRIAYGLITFGGIISFLVARKIASIGMRKGKEVRI